MTLGDQAEPRRRRCAFGWPSGSDNLGAHRPAEGLVTQPPGPRGARGFYGRHVVHVAQVNVSSSSRPGSTRSEGIADERNQARQVGLPSSESAYATHRGKRVSTVLGRERSLPEVTSDLKEALAQDGDRIVLCDLRGTTAPGPSVAKMFGPVANYLNHWPGAAVVVCTEDDAVLESLPDGAQPRLLARTDPGVGVAEMQQRLPQVQQSGIRLPPDPSAAREARLFTTRVLEDWQSPDAVGTATLVVSELVTNSIRHAQTVNQLTLSLADERLRIAVHDLADGSPQPSRPPEADALDGRGLFLVEVMSRTWGVFPSTASGKTVWAILDREPGQSERVLS